MERMYVYVVAGLWVVGSIPIAIKYTTSLAAAVYILIPAFASIPLLIAGCGALWERFRVNRKQPPMRHQ